MKTCKIVLRDEVNCRIEDIDPTTKRKMSKALEFFLQYARHVPSFKLGRWDGMKRFCDVGGRTYINLLGDVLPIAQDAGYDFEIVDNRTKYKFDFEEVNDESYSYILWPEGHVCEGEPIILKNHQVTAINAFINNLHSMAEISTGAGKTLITAILAEKVQAYGRSFVVVPSKDLVTQTERDFKLLGLDVGVYYGDRKEVGRTHTICTWQSLEALDKKKDNEYTLEEITEGVVAVIIDEAHGIKADVLFKHLTTTFKNTPIRWGMTGTIPLDKAESTSLRAAIGPIVNEISAKELQDKGVLSNLNIDIVQVQDYHSKHPDYKAELKYLVTTPNRIKFLYKNVIKNAIESGNTLILVDRLATGEILEEIIPDSVFINGSVKSSKRKAEYDSIKDLDGRTIIATYGVAAVGIDIPRIFNVILMEPGKGYIRIIQSIGRGIRRAEDKDFVNITDICSSAKYSKRHLTERKKFYKGKEYPFKVRKIQGDFL